MSADQKAYQATPNATLEQRIMDWYDGGRLKHPSVKVQG